MTRAERRRIERESKKIKLDGVTPEDFRGAMEQAEMHEQISRSVWMEKIADKAAKKANREDMQDLKIAAANQAYMDWIHQFEQLFMEAMLISFSLAIHDKFPRWGMKAVQEIVLGSAAWSDRFITEYKRDIIGFKNLYAITFGEPIKLQLVDLDREPIVGGNDLPKSGGTKYRKQ